MSALFGLSGDSSKILMAYRELREAQNYVTKTNRSLHSLSNRELTEALFNIHSRLWGFNCYSHRLDEIESPELQAAVAAAKEHYSALSNSYEGLKLRVDIWKSRAQGAESSASATNLAISDARKEGSRKFRVAQTVLVKAFVENIVGDSEGWTSCKNPDRSSLESDMRKFSTALEQLKTRLQNENTPKETLIQFVESENGFTHGFKTRCVAQLSLKKRDEHLICLSCFQRDIERFLNGFDAAAYEIFLKEYDPSPAEREEVFMNLSVPSQEKIADSFSRGLQNVTEDVLEQLSPVTLDRIIEACHTALKGAPVTGIGFIDNLVLSVLQKAPKQLIIHYFLKHTDEMRMSPGLSLLVFDALSKNEKSLKAFVPYIFEKITWRRDFDFASIPKDTNFDCSSDSDSDSDDETVSTKKPASSEPDMIELQTLSRTAAAVPAPQTTTWVNNSRLADLLASMDDENAPQAPVQSNTVASRRPLSSTPGANQTGASSQGKL